MREWDARCCRTTAGRRDARHHFASDAGGLQRLHFLATTAEHIRVTALQAQHTAAGAGVLDEQGMDALLWHAVITQRLADIYAQGLRRHQLQHLGCDEPVVHYHLGLLEALQRPQRQQVGGPRSGPDDADGAGCKRCRSVHVNRHG